MSHSCDLTPESYVKHRQIHSIVSAWSAAVACAGLICLFAVLLEHSRADESALRDTSERIARLQTQVKQATSKTETIHADIERYQRELKAEQDLTTRPDWSSAMNVVAAAFNEKVVMTGFSVGSPSDTGVSGSLGAMASDAPPDSRWMTLRGVAQSNTSVPDLISRLESIGLFEQVVMTQNQRDRFAGDARIRFTLACRLQ